MTETGQSQTTPGEALEQPSSIDFEAVQTEVNDELDIEYKITLFTLLVKHVIRNILSQSTFFRISTRALHSDPLIRLSVDPLLILIHLIAGIFNNCHTLHDC